MSILSFSAIANNSSYALQILLNVNKKAFSPGDTLVASGEGLANDALIAEVYNPSSRLVLRTQIDVDAEGSFSQTLLVWPAPDAGKYRLGTYTLVVKSSTVLDLRATDAFVFQSEPTALPGVVERKLDVDVSAPPVIGMGEVSTVVVQVTLNGVLVRGEAEETLKSSYIRFPNGDTVPLNNFSTADDGVYLADFSGGEPGHHTIHVMAVHQELVANKVAVVHVQDGAVLSVGSELERLNTNVESLREETKGKTKEISMAVSEISASVSEIGSAAGQVTSLLLPIIGMIAIIVALQATILARRK